jgi:hypothetical protein
MDSIKAFDRLSVIRPWDWASAHGKLRYSAGVICVTDLVNQLILMEGHGYASTRSIAVRNRGS